MNDEIDIQPFQYRPRYRIQIIHRKPNPICKMVVTDCQRAIEEFNDCTVRALSHATGKPYEKAHEFLQKHGKRAHGRGIHIEPFLDGFSANDKKILGREVNKFLCAQNTFGEFANANPKGRFILKTRKHAAAVVNGVLYDNADSSREKLLAVWELT